MTVNVDTLIDYETGQLGDREVVELFQELIDTGLAWHLQGEYGRIAQRLINTGWCHEREVPAETREEEDREQADAD